MTHKVFPRLLPVVFVIAVVFAVMGVARNELLPPQEAPAAFDNQTNGFTPDQKDFDEDRAAFDETEGVFHKPEVKDANGCVVQEEVRGGLGPVYNSTSCVACHQNAGFVDTPVMTTQKGSDSLSGISSQVSEIRAGHNEVIDNRILFRDAPGGSVIQQRAIDPRRQESVPVEENIRTLRMATSVLGDGFVESIPDEDIIKIRNAQPPDVRGFAVCVPAVVRVKTVEDGQPTDFVFEARVGRFGWKNQESSLLNFAAGAYVAEMGITSPLQRDENLSLGRPVAEFDPIKDPEDRAHLPTNKFGKDVEAFARFMRSTKVPPRGPITADVTAGERVFNQVGCNACHIDKFQTAPPGTQFGELAVDNTLGDKIIHPYSDFLLHDVGTVDGIVQTQYAEFPATGITQNGVINVDRLNDLLKCISEPGSPSVNRLQDRQALSQLQSEYERTPVIHVERPTASSRRVINLLGLGALSPETNELFQMPLLYTITTAQMIRTAPLWGMRTRPQLLHDGRALTLIDAIEAHHNQAEKSRLLFNARTVLEKKQLLAFLNSL